MNVDDTLFLSSEGDFDEIPEAKVKHLRLYKTPTCEKTFVIQNQTPWKLSDIYMYKKVHSVVLANKN